MASTPTIIRKSPIFFTFKLLTMVIVLSILYSIFIYGTDIDTNLNASFSFFQTMQVGLVAFFAAIIIEVIYGLLLILHWTHDTYEIHFDEIVHRSGFFTIQEKRFALKNIERIFCKQTVSGRILRYGSIELQGRFLKDPFVMKGISDASYHADFMKQTTILSSSTA